MQLARALVRRSLLVRDQMGRHVLRRRTPAAEGHLLLVLAQLAPLGLAPVWARPLRWLTLGLGCSGGESGVGVLAKFKHMCSSLAPTPDDTRKLAQFPLVSSLHGNQTLERQLSDERDRHAPTALLPETRTWSKFAR